MSIIEDLQLGAGYRPGGRSDHFDADPSRPCGPVAGSFLMRQLPVGERRRDSKSEQTHAHAPLPVGHHAQYQKYQKNPHQLLEH